MLNACTYPPYKARTQLQKHNCPHRNHIFLPNSPSTFLHAYNSHEATLVVGEHTERLPAVPVDEHCAGLTVVGGGAVGKRDSRRLPHHGGSGDERYPTSPTTLWSCIYESLYCVISQSFLSFYVVFKLHNCIGSHGLNVLYTACFVQHCIVPVNVVCWKINETYTIP